MRREREWSPERGPNQGRGLADLERMNRHPVRWNSLTRSSKGNVDLERKIIEISPGSFPLTSVSTRSFTNNNP